MEKNNKNINDFIADVVKCDGFPEGEDHMQYIKMINNALGAWRDCNDNRGYILIAVGESKLENENREGVLVNSAFGFGGNTNKLVGFLSVLMEQDDTFRKLLYSALMLNKKEG
jgi:hypothetical protein